MYITCYIHALFKITINLAEYFVICNLKLKLLLIILILFMYLQYQFFYPQFDKGTAT